MIKSESGIKFEFADDYTVIKYDDTEFHKRCFNPLPGAKAVDFLVANDNSVILIEVKNCAGNEAGNRWRIAPNNSKRDTISTDHDVSDRDSLDIEIPHKVAMTIAALIGAYSRPTPHKHADECAPIAQKLCSEAVHNGLRHIYVILVLEGTFGNGLQTNTERMVRDRIARMMGRKMKWLNCHIQVVTTQEIGNVIPGVSAAIEA